MDDTVVKRGVLSSGQPWEVVRSAKSALPEGQGEHYILHFPGDVPREEMAQGDIAETLGLLEQLGAELSAGIDPGRWRAEYNGPRAASRSHFHVHIICPAKNLQIRRCVDSIVIPTKA